MAHATYLLSRTVRPDAEVLGLGASGGNLEAFAVQTALQQLAYRSCAGRHAMPKPPVIESLQLIGAQHDLQSFAAGEFGHGQVLG
jgi:hypothetical protein